MLIHIAATPSQLEALPQALVLSAMEELARAHRHGSHFVITARETARWVANLEGLSSFTRAAFEYIGQSYSQYGRLTEKAEIYIELVPDSSRTQNRFSRKIIQVSITETQNPSFLNPAKLIVEDLDDFHLYNEIADILRVRVGVPKLKLQGVNGGGGSTHKSAAQAANAREIFLIILDSDIRYPGSQPSKAAHRLHEQILKHTTKTHDVIVLECHEIENLIPIDVIQTLPCAANRQSSLIQLIQIEQQKRSPDGKNEFLEVFDFKSGFPRKPLEDICDRNEANWIEKATQELNVGHIEGFGEGIVQQILSNGKTINIFRSAIKRTTWQNRWSEMLFPLVWYGLASPPMRT